jgi:protein-disulfide isomerase
MLGSVACGRPGQAGAETAPGQIDLTSPGGPNWPGFEPEGTPPELTDADVEQLATRVAAQRVPRVSADNPSKGPASAPVTLQVFSDFECPFCVRAAPTLTRIEARFRGRVRLVWRNYPLPSHDRARPLARAVLAAYALGGADKFWQLHDWLFSPRADQSDEGLRAQAVRLGLDATRFDEAMNSPTYDVRVSADVAAGDTAGVEGTPAVFINDYYLMGARHEAEYAIVVERALRDADSHR